MLGFKFNHCHPFNLSFSFENCNLTHASFYKTKIKKTRFKNIQLTETDFTECDLTEAIFEHCDLSGVTFDNTILTKADLTTAYHYTIDPEINRIKKARFALTGVAGLLTKFDIVIDHKL